MPSMSTRSKLPPAGYSNAVLDRVKSLPDRWPWLRLIVDVHQRFSELHGGYLAAAITLAAFLSLFPIALVGIAVIGFFSANTSDLPARMIEWMGIPPNGEAAEALTNAIGTAEESKTFASLLGLAGLLWTGLGLVAALQYVYDSVWQVKGRGWRDKGAGMAWLVGAATLFVGSFGVTALLGFLPGWLAPLNLLAAVLLSFALFLWTSKVLANRDVGIRALVPGAVFAAVGLEVLKLVGGFYVPRAVASSSALYGSIGTVFALLAWLFFFGRLVVYSASLNVVLWERKYGTVTVELQAPRLPGVVPLEATRAGEVTEPPAPEESDTPQLTLDLDRAASTNGRRHTPARVRAQ